MDLVHWDFGEPNGNDTISYFNEMLALVSLVYRTESRVLTFNTRTMWSVMYSMLTLQFSRTFFAQPAVDCWSIASEDRLEHVWMCWEPSSYRRTKRNSTIISCRITSRWKWCLIDRLLDWERVFRVRHFVQVMPFGKCTYGSPKSHVLDGARITPREGVLWMGHTASCPDMDSGRCI